MSPVESKKRLCRPVEFKGQGPHGEGLDGMGWWGGGGSKVSMGL